ATIKNSSVALNHVKATNPAAGGTATAQGGGLTLNNGGSLTDDTVAGNTVSATAGGTHTATGGGLYVSSTNPALKDSIVARNHAASGPDCFGGPTSQGHNLIGKKAGCSFTQATGDRVNVGPQLGPLANHGGPTQTMGIASTSPAHNAVPLSACPLHSDQP